MSLVVLGLVLLLAVLGHGFLWMDGVNRLHAWAGPRFLIDYPTYAAVLAFFGLPLLVIWDWWQLDTNLYDYVWSQPKILPKYVQLCALWGTIKLCLHCYYQQAANNPRTLLSVRREQTTQATQLDPWPVYGTFARLLARIPGNQCLQLTVDHKQIAIPRLHPNHVGLRIAHLSDLHMTGRIGQKWFDLVVDETNRLEPDVIAITGDILEEKTCWPWLTETIARLRAKYGVYFILGNHDFFLDTSRTRETLTDAGMTCVHNSWVEVRWNDAAVAIAGNERPWANDNLDQQPLPVQIGEQVPLKLVLSHSPDQFAWSQRQDADLVLAGHTHGGQIRFPILGAVACPSMYGTRYACGVFRAGETVMHVSRGVSGETPFRWDCPPEIALLELANANR